MFYKFKKYNYIIYYLWMHKKYIPMKKGNNQNILLNDFLFSVLDFFQISSPVFVGSSPFFLKKKMSLDNFYAQIFLIMYLSVQFSVQKRYCRNIQFQSNYKSKVCRIQDFLPYQMLCFLSLS